MQVHKSSAISRVSHETTLIRGGEFHKREHKGIVLSTNFHASASQNSISKSPMRAQHFASSSFFRHRVDSYRMIHEEISSHVGFGVWIENGNDSQILQLHIPIPLKYFPFSFRSRRNDFFFLCFKAFQSPQSIQQDTPVDIFVVAACWLLGIVVMNFFHFFLLLQLLETSQLKNVPSQIVLSPRLECCMCRFMRLLIKGRKICLRPWRINHSVISDSTQARIEKFQFRQQQRTCARRNTAVLAPKSDIGGYSTLCCSRNRSVAISCGGR